MKFSALPLLLAALAAPALAQRVNTADLGALELAYVTAEATDRYDGPPLAAEVAFRPGEAFSVVTPYRVQQITYLVEPGVPVTRGQPVARLAGAEIHHFLTEFEIAGRRLELARRRFESNRALYRKHTIDEAKWIGISEAYYSLQLEYGHLRHFRELLAESETDKDSVILQSPLDGRLLYRQDSPGIPEGGELALVVPPGALRLRVAVPLAQRQGLAGLRRGECDLAVTGVSRVSTDFFVEAWSAPLTPACDFLPGERLMVTPYYRRTVYSVPGEALFTWQGAPALLLRDGQELEVVPVEVVASGAERYQVGCAADLAGREILSRSVSAVQGILLGLGGE